MATGSATASAVARASPATTALAAASSTGHDLPDDLPRVHSLPPRDVRGIDFRHGLVHVLHNGGQCNGLATATATATASA